MCNSKGECVECHGDGKDCTKPCCPDTICEDGTCTTCNYLGDPCADAPCCSDLVCFDNVCSDPACGEDGDECMSANDCCGSTMVCSARVCAYITSGDGEEGDDCTTVNDCGGDLVCGKDDKCGAQTNIWLIIGLSLAGVFLLLIILAGVVVMMKKNSHNKEKG